MALEEIITYVPTAPHIKPNRATLTCHSTEDDHNPACRIHLIGAYQVFMQPFMAFVESKVLDWFPNSAILRLEKRIPVPGFGHLVLSPLKLVLRCDLRHV